jgi:hypothetical protein
MAVNEDNDDQRRGRAIGRISSQAGLNAYAGGRAKSLPSAPAPGQPGSRFNPVVADRGERVNHEEAVKGSRTKSLPLNTPPGMIQGIPPAIMNQTREEDSEQTVAGAAAQGFAGGFLGGLQNSMFGSSSGGQQDDLPEFIDHRTLPTNQKGEPLTPDEYITLSRQRHAIEKASIERGEMGLKSMTPGPDRTRVEVTLNSRRQILQDSATRTDALELSMRSQGFLAPTNSPAVETKTPAPVRNADGKSLVDLTAPAPGEDPLPGTTQPLIVDALQEVQGIPPRSAAKGITKGVSRAVVMNPAHVAGLASLEDGRGDSLEREGGGYSR